MEGEAEALTVQSPEAGSREAQSWDSTPGPHLNEPQGWRWEGQGQGPPGWRPGWVGVWIGELKGDPRAGRGAAQIHVGWCETQAGGSRA